MKRVNSTGISHRLNQDVNCLKPATFSADSVESMAGISAADLSAPADQELTDLLGENESRQQIDMSALSKGARGPLPQGPKLTSRMTYSILINQNVNEQTGHCVIPAATSALQIGHDLASEWSLSAG